jgi:DNA end-binding protein Ku
MAEQLITSMSGKWRPADYRDTYADRVQELIKSKQNDKEYEPAPEAPSATGAGDLLEALRRSVESAKKGGSRTTRKSAPTKTAAPKTTARKTTARKTTARKTPGKTAERKTAARKTTARKSAARSAA